MDGQGAGTLKVRFFMESDKKITYLVLLCFSLAFAVVLASGREALGAESEWPVEIAAAEGKITLYQPQPDSLKDDKLTGRSAVSFTPNGAQTPIFGAFWFDARISTDRDERTVTLREMSILQVKFPQSSADLEKTLVQALKNEIPRMNVTFSLDRLLTTLEEAEKVQMASEKLKTDPPKIVFSETPSILITIDGLPQLRPLPETQVMMVVNTPFVLLFDPAQKTYYLKGGEEWFSAKDALGPWRGEPNPPESILTVPLREMEKGKEGAPPKQSFRSKMEKIIVATEPTELIVSNGSPRYMPIQGTDLLFMSNTNSDVFMDIGSQSFYVAIAGRWYRSASLNGPWAYVPADGLPAGFGKIPPASPKGNVLVYVAGTQQAKEAILEASLPQTAAIKRNITLDVSYDGPPKFEAVEGTNLRYAVNSPYEVIEYRDRFYACHQGVWYKAEDPAGPWTVATEVPDEIYSIPPSSPLYHVKYVRVYDSTPEEVYVGYYPGYLGWYVYGPTVVFGTGWYYPGWYGSYYYPHPWTWGFGFNFTPYVGWSFGLNYGYWWPGAWVGYGPVGAWWGGGRGGWWGPHGYHPPVAVPYVGRHFGGGPGSSGPHHSQPYRKDYYYRNNLYSSKENIARRADFGKPQPGGALSSARRGQESNNVFADRSGNVQRYSKDGWERREAGGWSKSRPQGELDAGAKSASRQGVERSRAVEGRRTPGSGIEAGSGVARRSQAPLDREQFARQRGSERASSFQRFRGNTADSGAPGRSWSGPARQDGGAFRGGGNGGFLHGIERTFPGGGGPGAAGGMFRGGGESGGFSPGGGRTFPGGGGPGGGGGKGIGRGMGR